MKYIVICILLISSMAWANRVPELEEYYVKKTSDLLQTRFPAKPFTVFAKVDTGGENFLRDSKKTNRNKNNYNNNNDARLPYLGVDDEAEAVDFWSRTDLPIGTLISQLEKVEIKVKIDSSITEEEMTELTLSMSEQLKLVPGTDSIVIEKMDWTAKENSKLRMWMVGGFLLGLFALFVVLYLVSKLSVTLLAKKLAEPISEIGKSTQAFANNALNIANDNTAKSSASIEEGGEEAELSLGANLLELRNGGLELLNRNLDLLKTPDVEVMEFLERYGAANPRAMGAILAELDEKTLRTLFTYGTGDWWFVALSQPSPMNQASIKILNEVDRLRLRRNFDTSNDQLHNEESRLAGLAFGRLSVEQLVQVFKGRKLEEIDPVLNILPKAFSLAVGKDLFPGKWAILLDENRKVRPLEMNALKELRSKALEQMPLREGTEIKAFFRDLDISRYLDTASFRDEKEFYMALSDDSRLKQDRVPYYSIFDAEAEVVKLMSSDLAVDEWICLLFHAESMEREHFLKSMTERLSYMIREGLKNIDESKWKNDFVRNTKKKALHSYLNNTKSIEWNRTAIEVTPEKENHDEEAA